MELPRALMPWAEWLDVFPTELIAPMGELVRRVDLAIGPMRAPNVPGRGEPDGFDGIARRGDYDRLLLSEWLLADEAPDEFMRRAAMNELMFLEPARVAPAGARCSVALFDAGPNQLGTPRLAHLAALIVLARRAQGAGAQFYWGLLQEAERNLRPEVTRGSLAHLLKARCLREARDKDVADWRAQANSLVGMEDCWLVGGRRLQEFPSSQGARVLQVADPLDPESQYLDVVIRQSMRPLSQLREKRVEGGLQLPLPPGDTCARLLREPFHNRVAELSRVKKGRRPVSNLVYVSDNRLVARTAPDQIVLYSPPNTPTGNLAKPKLYSSIGSGNILAVGKAGKGVALIATTDNPDRLRIVRVGSQSGKVLTGEFEWPLAQVPPQDAQDRLAQCYFTQDKAGNSSWQITLNHVQIQVTAGSVPNTLAAQVIRPNLAFEPALRGGQMIGIDMAGVRMALKPLPSLAPGVPEEKEITYAEFPAARTAYMGSGGILTHSDYGFWAVETAPGQWKILHQDGNGKEAQTEISIDSDVSVVGVVALPGVETGGYGAYNYAPALVALAQNRRVVAVLGKGWERLEPPAAATIAQITVSPYEPNVAYVTTSGEVVVYSLVRQTALYRLDTEARG